MAIRRQTLEEAYCLNPAARKPSRGHSPPPHIAHGANGSRLPLGARLGRASDMPKRRENLYKAGEVRGPNEKWKPQNRHPDLEIAAYIDSVRARSRAISRDTPYGAAFLDRLEQDVVGVGIQPAPAAVRANGEPAKGFNEEAAALWEFMADRIELCRMRDVYTLQSDVLRCWAEAGAWLGQFVMRPQDADLPIPLQINGIEPDYLQGDSFLSDTGNEIRRGIEIDRETNRIVAFHLIRGNNLYASGAIKRYPAENFCYVFRPDRFGQTLGMPWAAPVIQRVYNLDDYYESEVLRAREHAKRSQAIKTTDPQGRMTSMSTAVKYEGEDGEEKEERVEPITFGRLYLGTNEDIVSLDSNVPPTNFDEFVTHQGRTIAIGTGPSYEGLTGDHTKTHFSASRATWQRDVRFYKWLQKALVWHFCRPLYEKMIEVGVLTGYFSRISRAQFFGDPLYRWRMTRCNWRPPGFRWHAPKEDVDAAIKETALGVRTRDDICMQLHGRSFADVLRERAEERRLIAEAGMDDVISEPTFASQKVQADEGDADKKGDPDAADNTKESK